MHCGLCLSVCPTYALTGLERSSPRGRIRLMKNAMDGTIPFSETFKYEMDFCLDCQACQTACPAGVEYGKLVESARALIAARKTGIDIKRIILRRLFGGRTWFRLAASLLRFYQKSGLEKFLLNLTSGLKGDFFARARLLPRLSERFSIDFLPEKIEARGTPRGKTAVLTGCVMDAMFADANVDTVEVLVRNGWQVAVPHDQVCCGSVSAHSGDMELARKLAVRNMDVFEKTGAEYYVINSAGCSAFMKEYRELFASDPVYSKKAEEFSSKVKEFSEFISETGYMKPSVKFDVPVTYHEPCHLVHTQKISGQPRSVVKELAGQNFRELGEATWCCGSAGIYNVTHVEAAASLLERKLGNIEKSGAKVVVTGNPGCIAQIAAGARNDGKEIEVLHLATALNRLYKSEEDA